MAKENSVLHRVSVTTTVPGVTVRVAPNSGLLLRNVIRRKSWLHVPSSFFTPQ